MSALFKPYRIINEHECNMLQQKIQNRLQQWNKEHALFPLSCTISTFNRVNTIDKIATSNAWFADSDELNMMKYCLFGDESPCFNSIAKTVFTALINQLIASPTFSGNTDDWFYSGSPSLTLALHCNHKKSLIYLHPQWVLSELKSKSIKKKPIASLQQALEKQPLHLDVALDSIHLKLSAILTLKPGDVIQTNHSINKPMYLSPISNVHIGKLNTLKSIQFAR